MTMNTLYIAFKDLRRTFSNPFSLVMRLGAPLIVTGLLFFAFGNMGGEGDTFNLPTSQVQVVNLGHPSGTSGGFDAGEMLLSFLQDENLNEMMRFERVDDEVTARSAVEEGKAEMALIIPEGFTSAAITPREKAVVHLYQDPTLTIAPGILESLLHHFMDGFSGAKIATRVTSKQFEDRGIEVDQRSLMNISARYASWLENGGHQENGQEGSAIRFTSPSGTPSEADTTESMVGPIMAGMTVFFLFFMAANSTQSIIREDEEGTLARLFTTPTKPWTILSGKLFGVLATIIIQAALLIVAAHFLFNIHWGQPATVLIVVSGNLVLAAGFGIFIMSFIQNTRQTGPVLGGALTVTGMLGGLFTNGMLNLPEALDTARLVVPQGWAMQGWELSLSGAEPSEVLSTVLVMLAVGLAFFAFGVLRFRRRFN
jgi:ABC-2 type transport system permease protein